MQVLKKKRNQVIITSVIISHFYASDYEHLLHCYPTHSLSLCLLQTHMCSLTKSLRAYVDKTECNGVQHHLLLFPEAEDNEERLKHYTL